MRRNLKLQKLTLAGAAMAVVLTAAAIFGVPTAPPTLANLFPFPNPSGILETASSTGSIDLTNPFFQSLGTNDRSCATCHLPDQGWTVAANQVQARFNQSGGLDPIFRTVDGSNCDHDIDTSTVDGRRNAYSLLTGHGLLRIALAVPAGAQFQVADVQNPYGCNETDVLSMYRRPLPATNLRFLTSVMWDGRESTPPSTEDIHYVSNPNDLAFDLAHQALDATNGHEQAVSPLTSVQQTQIVNFETSLTTAQAADNQAGNLAANGAHGGPASLAAQQFFVGINDPAGNNPQNIPFTPLAFNLFSAWTTPGGPVTPARLSIARGEAIFNTRPIRITNVEGLNDVAGQPVVNGTCSSCHNTPNVGNHSFPAFLNLGTGDPRQSPLDLSYLPQIALINNRTGATITTTDPGRALVTGAWPDVGKIKVPVLRGLAARAPYFHNGSARNLQDVVRFYDGRFRLGLNPQERADLVAFLNSL